MMRENSYKGVGLECWNRMLGCDGGGDGDGVGGDGGEWWW